MCVVQNACVVSLGAAVQFVTRHLAAACVMITMSLHYALTAWYDILCSAYISFCFLYRMGFFRMLAMIAQLVAATLLEQLTLLVCHLTDSVIAERTLQIQDVVHQLMVFLQDH